MLRTTLFPCRLPATLRAGAAALLLILIAPATVHASDNGGKRPMTPVDVAYTRMVYDIAISPDGQQIAYILGVPRDPFNEPDGGAWTELHLVDRDGNSRPMITGRASVSGIEWTPDGTHIAFLAKRDGDKQRSLYVLPADGGEARRVLTHKTAILSVSWSPDGKQVAFRAEEPQKGEKDKKARAKQGFNAEAYEEDWQPVHVYVAPVDLAYQNPGPRAAKPAKPRKLDLPGSVSSIAWSPDGKHLAFVASATPAIDDEMMFSKLHVANIETGEVVGTFETAGKLGQYAWSPDGKHIALIAAQDINDPAAGRLWVGDATGGAMRDLLPDLEGHIAAIGWLDDNTIAHIADVGVQTRYGTIKADGSAHRTLIEPKAGEPILSRLSVCRKDGAVAFAGDAPTHPSEVFSLRPAARALQRLTNCNPWLDEIELGEQEVVEYKARDGLMIQGVLIHPLDEQPGQRYPLVLDVHGGPEARDANGWMTRYASPGQVAAGRGIAVFYPNYRGSTGRGVEFSKLDQRDYAGAEFNDLVDAKLHLVERGIVDKDKVAITGGSYGGYATAWGATALSEHFAAGVMFVGISELYAKFGSTDIPQEMHLVHSRIWPWEDWDFYRDRSPVYHVAKAKTPLLILHGKKDPRVHPSQSLILYRYIKTYGDTPVRLVWYPNEGHGNRRAAARLDYNLRSMRWLEHYLKGPGGQPPAFEIDYDQVEKQFEPAGETDTEPADDAAEE